MNFVRLNAYLAKVGSIDPEIQKLSQDLEKELQLNEFLLEGKRTLSLSIELLEVDVYFLQQLYNKRLAERQVRQLELKSATECYGTGIELQLLLKNLEIEKIFRFGSLRLEQTTQRDTHNIKEYYINAEEMNEAMENRYIVQKLRNAQNRVKEITAQIEELTLKQAQTEMLWQKKIEKTIKERNDKIVDILKMRVEIIELEARLSAQPIDEDDTKDIRSLNYFPSFNQFYAAFEAKPIVNIETRNQPLSILITAKTTDETLKGKTSTTKRVQFNLDDKSQEKDILIANEANEDANIIDSMLDSDTLLNIRTLEPTNDDHIEQIQDEDTSASAVVAKVNIGTRNQPRSILSTAKATDETLKDETSTTKRVHFSFDDKLQEKDILIANEANEDANIIGSMHDSDTLFNITTLDKTNDDNIEQIEVDDTNASAVIEKVNIETKNEPQSIFNTTKATDETLKDETSTTKRVQFSFDDKSQEKDVLIANEANEDANIIDSMPDSDRLFNKTTLEPANDEHIEQIKVDDTSAGAGRATDESVPAEISDANYQERGSVIRKVQKIEITENILLRPADNIALPNNSKTSEIIEDLKQSKIVTSTDSFDMNDSESDRFSENTENSIHNKYPIDIAYLKQMLNIGSDTETDQQQMLDIDIPSENESNEQPMLFIPVENDSSGKSVDETSSNNNQNSFDYHFFDFDATVGKKSYEL